MVPLLLPEITDASRLKAVMHASRKLHVACNSINAALELQLCVHLHEMYTTDQSVVQYFTSAHCKVC
jgi:hypothetical protein